MLFCKTLPTPTDYSVKSNHIVQADNSFACSVVANCLDIPWEAKLLLFSSIEFLTPKLSKGEDVEALNFQTKDNKRWCQRSITKGHFFNVISQFKALFESCLSCCWNLMTRILPSRPAKANSFASWQSSDFHVYVIWVFFFRSRSITIANWSPCLPYPVLPKEQEVGC